MFLEGKQTGTENATELVENNPKLENGSENGNNCDCSVLDRDLEKRALNETQCVGV